MRARPEAAFLKAAHDPRFVAVMAQLNVPMQVLDGEAMRKDLVEKHAQDGKAAREYGLLP